MASATIITAEPADIQPAVDACLLSGTPLESNVSGDIRMAEKQSNTYLNATKTLLHELNERVPLALVKR